MSRTVTVAVQVAVLPLPSATVRVTTFDPRFEQVKALWDTTCAVGVPQLSVELLLTWEAVMVALFPLKFTVMFWQRAVGGVTSRTVTTAVQVAVLPLPSLAVKVTTFAPRFEQVKPLGDTDCAFTAPQLSVEDPVFNTCAAVKLALFPLKFTVIFWQTAVGGVLSCTVTTALQVALRPLLPVTVKTTVLFPRLEQLKPLGETPMLWMPPTALLPPSTLAALIVAVPPLFRATV